MTSIVEEEIFALEPALILSKFCAESVLKDNFADLHFELINSILEIRVMCFSSRSAKGVDLSKLKATCKNELNKVLDQYAPSIYREFIFLEVKNPLIYPKYYYLMVKNKAEGKKGAVFNAINKLNSVNLSSEIEGVRVRVKGKKGTRKGAKCWYTGRVGRHSNLKNKLLKYMNCVIDNKGVSGVQVELQYTDSYLRKTQEMVHMDSSLKNSHSGSSEQQKEKGSTSRLNNRDPVDKIERFNKKTAPTL